MVFVSRPMVFLDGRVRLFEGRTLWALNTIDSGEILSLEFFLKNSL
jgi:hypothetical protein